MFVDKHTETIEYENFLRKIQTSLVSNSRILKIRYKKAFRVLLLYEPEYKAKFSNLH